MIIFPENCIVQSLGRFAFIGFEAKVNMSEVESENEGQHRRKVKMVGLSGSIGIVNT